jgi:hypothetical protein
MDGIMDFKKISRMLMTRGIEYTPEQMVRYGIKVIYNSVSTFDYADLDVGDDMRMEGQYSLKEKSVRKRFFGDPVITCSVIVFTDEVSLHLFLYASSDIYRSGDYMKTLMN